MERDAEIGDERGVWERRLDEGMLWTPYITLVAGLVLTLVQPGQSWSYRFGTIGLAGLAGAWVYLTFSRLPQDRREQPLPATFYFVGLLAFASVLMLRGDPFLIFMVTGFLHAGLFRHWAGAVLAATTTSFLINTVLAGFPEPNSEAITRYLSVIAIQGGAIGIGAVAGNKIAELSEERRQTVRRLEATLEENVGLHAQLLTQAREAGVHDERQRMAREIHDTIAQGLTGIVAQVQAAKQARDNPDALNRHLDAAAALARESLAEARRSVQALGPQALEEGRLADALSDVVHRWSEHSGVAAEVTTTGTARRLHPEVEVALLRVTQEALANVGKHANATTVRLTLSYMEDVVTLDVVDDGIGFVVEPSARPRDHGYGLTTMRQRVEGLSGRLEVESEPGSGTAVSASVPAIPMEAGDG